MSAKLALTPHSHTYFASCAVGLEVALSQELKELGIEKLETSRGGVNFQTDIDSLFKTLLETRIASRIYRKIYSFDIDNEQDLYHRGLAIKWEQLFSLDQAFKIKVIQSSSPNNKKRSKFRNSLFLTYKLKDAIIDYFSTKFQDRPDIDVARPDISFLVHVEPHNDLESTLEHVSILVDLSGYPLYKRGYKFQEFTAPLKETLAAGLIKLTNWDGKMPLVDMMCGSGTFLTEALLISSHTSPTAIKQDQGYWAFKDHLWFLDNKENQDAWERQITTKRILEQPTKVYGNDLSNEAIRVTSAHTEAIKMGAFLNLSKMDALKYMPPTEEAGIVVMNPPYGERLGELDDLKLLYKSLGDHFKTNWKGWRIYLLVGELELIKHVGLRSSKKHIVFNGPIECRWVEYQLY